MKPKNELTRVVKSPEGEVTLDITGKKPGRGTYICSDENCLKKIKKSNALSRTFKTKVPDTIIEDIESNP